MISGWWLGIVILRRRIHTVIEKSMVPRVARMTAILFTNHCLLSTAAPPLQRRHNVKSNGPTIIVLFLHYANVEVDADMRAAECELKLRNDIDHEIIF